MTNAKHKLPILLYHRIVKSKADAGHQKIYVYEEQLRKQFEHLKKNNIQTITFRELNQATPSTDFNNKIILTFDDGYEDNYTLLFPLLKEFGFTAVIYLVTRLKRNEWGIKENEPACNLLSTAQIKEMDAFGIEFGSHTCTHQALNHLSIQEARVEIEDSKKDIEELLQKPILSFAYPYGGISPQVKELVKAAGIPFAISTKTGPMNWFDDKMQLRRIEIRPGESLGSFANKAGGYYLTKQSIYTILSTSNKIYH
jgi:peptidoglycan/xylan/chitin deacetylase (PgdA/CDA1 family)